MKSIPFAAGNYFGNIESLKNRKDPEALKSAAKELESLFAYEMIKAMRETTDTKDGGFGKDTYMSMFDMELSRLLAERGLGLKEILLKGLNRHQVTQDEKAEDSAEPSSQAINGSSHAKAINRHPTVSEVKPETASTHKPVFSLPSPKVSDSDLTGTEREESSMPVDGRISSGFGMRRHPIYGGMRFHHGIDIAAPEGTEVYPFKGGKVIYSGQYKGYGNVVIIDHGDGFVSRYAHNRVNLVKQGDMVDPDTVIAEVGSTGISTGPHLHFEVRQNGRSMDPAKVLAMR